MMLRGGVRAAERPVVVTVSVELLPGVTEDGEKEHFTP